MFTYTFNINSLYISSIAICFYFYMISSVSFSSEPSFNLFFLFKATEASIHQGQNMMTLQIAHQKMNNMDLNMEATVILMITTEAEALLVVVLWDLFAYNQPTAALNPHPHHQGIMILPSTIQRIAMKYLRLNVTEINSLTIVAMAVSFKSF